MAFVEHKMSISFPPVYYFYLFISLLVAFKDTVSCFLCTYCPVCEPTVHAECSLKADSQWDNKRLRVRIWGVPKQTSTTLHPPPPSKSPLHAHPCFAQYTQTSPKPSQHSTKCLFINFHSPTSAKKWLQQQNCTSASLSLSQLSPSTQASKLTSFFCLFWYMYFPHLLKWSEVSIHSALLVWGPRSWEPFLNAKYITALY